MTPRCFVCRGPYHEASGHNFREFADVFYCGACIRHFLTWMRGHMKRKWGALNFYEEAARGCWAQRNGSSSTLEIAST